MTKNELLNQLRLQNACKAAIEWVEAQPTDDAQSIWEACDRGDWMLWLAGTHSGAPESEGRKRLVLAACECARLALPVWEKRYPKDDRVKVCIETAERWARDKATIGELRAASAPASEAAYAYAYDASAYAAVASAAASAASDASDAAAYAVAFTQSVAAARTRVLKECAHIVRKHYPTIPTS